MCKKLMFLISFVFLLGLASSALAADLEVLWSIFPPPGGCYVVVGTEEYDHIYVSGCIIVPTGATLIVNEESDIDGNGDDGEGGVGATILVDGGTFIMRDRLNMGRGEDAYLIVDNGGIVTHDGDKITVPDDPGGEHRIIILDGSMTAEEIEIIHDRDAKVILGCNATIEVCKTDEDDSRDPDQWLADGDLLCDVSCSAGVMTVTDLGGNCKEAICLLVPDEAWGPTPKDGAVGQVVDVNLEWKAGAGAARHMIYFGTDEAEVDSAGTTDPQFQGLKNAGQELWDLDVDSSPAIILELWKTYFWRVDEFTPPNPNPIKGNVWSFTTGCEIMPGDINLDCVVNLLDYAMLADDWGDESFFPPERQGEVPIPVVVFPEDGSVLTGTELVIAGLLNEDKVAPYEISLVRFEYSEDGTHWTRFYESTSTMNNIQNFSFDEWDGSWDTSELGPGAYLIRIAMDTIYGREGTSEPISVTINLPPTPEATVEANGPAGYVTLDGSLSFDPDGTVEAYMWDFGDGTTGEGVTVDHIYEPNTTYEVVLTVVDKAGVLISSFYELTTALVPNMFAALPKCICTGIQLRGDNLPGEKEALGPDGEPGGTTWTPKVGEHGGNKLGPLEGDPQNDTVGGEKNATGYAFEIVVDVEGDPSLCKEIQLIKDTHDFVLSKEMNVNACNNLGGTWNAKTRMCKFTMKSHTQWSGTTSDTNLDGVDDIDVSTQANCIAAGGTWDGTRCNNVPFPQSGANYKPDGHAYRSPYSYKKHPDKKIIWWDAPRIMSSATITVENGTTGKRDFIAIIKGTDCKYCYVKYTVDCTRKEGEDDEKLTQVGAAVRGADSPPAVGKVP